MKAPLQTFYSLRSQVLFLFIIVGIICALTLSYAYTKIAAIDDVGQHYSSQNLDIKKISNQALELAHQAQISVLQASVDSEVSKRLEKMELTAGRLQGSIADFGILIQALQFGTAGQQFNKANGGLLRTQWHRRGWDNRFKVENVSDEVKALAKKIELVHEEFAINSQSALQKLKRSEFYRLQGQISEAKKLRAESFLLLNVVSQQLNKIEALVVNLNSLADTNLELALNSYENTRHSLINSLLYLAVAAIFVVFIAVWLMLSSIIIRPVAQIRSKLEEIGNGNLNIRFGSNLQDEFGSLMRSIDGMTASLSQEVVSKNFVDNILGSLVDALIVVSEDGYIKRLNSAALKLLNYAEIELIDNSINKIVEQKVSSDYLNEKERVELFEKGSISNIEKAFITKDGQTIPVLFSASLMIGKDGAIEGIVCVAQDIRLRKLDEQENEKLRSALAAANIGASRLDSSGRYVVVDDVYASLLGYTPEELINQSWEITVHPDDIERCRAAHGDMTKNGRANLDVRGIKKDGTKFYKRIIMVAEHHGSNYGLGGHVCFSQNINKEKRAEIEILHARDKALELSKLKSAFLANMSHEIRTPMNGVIGMADILLESNLNEEQRDLANTVKQSGYALLTIINDILDFSKIEAGKLTVMEEPGNFSKWFSGLTSLLEIYAKPKDIEVLVNLDSSIPEILVGDFTRLQQILINLAGNSIKFTPRGGGVILTARLVEIINKDVSIAFTISDSGIGIPKEHHSSIFEAFHQGDSSTTRKYGGTGLGLAISKSLVDLMHGKIEFVSKPGIGTSFHLDLTLRLPEIIQSGSDLKVDADQTRKVTSLPCSLRVLLAEDNKVNQKVARMFLEKRGCKVEIAENGQEAIDKYFAAKSEQFDLIIMDCQMPVLGGLEATRIIREKEKSLSTRVPIVAMTAHAMIGDKARCLEAGMDDYISKPFKPADLMAVLHFVAQSKP